MDFLINTLQTGPYQGTFTLGFGAKYQCLNKVPKYKNLDDFITNQYYKSRK